MRSKLTKGECHFTTPNQIESGPSPIHLLYPFMPRRCRRHRSIFANIKSNLFRSQALLQSSRLWMCATTTEKRRRFHTKIPHFFSTSIQQGPSILGVNDGFFILDGLFFLLGHGFLEFALLGKMLDDGSKVTFFEFLDGAWLLVRGGGEEEGGREGGRDWRRKSV